MTRYLALEEVIALHELAIKQSGGMPGLRDVALLESALAQPRLTFDGKDLFPDLVDKAAALGFSLICNHAFVDGNKRIGHLAMEMFLLLNGYEIVAETDEQEAIILNVAAGNSRREIFTEWLRSHTKPARAEPSS
jgi:death-on-curing protein